jgi:alpha-galactosidase
MPGPAALLTHERAGRVEPTRLGVRLAEPTAGEPRLEVAAFAAGALRLGPAALEVRVESAADHAHLDARVRNAGDRELRLASVLLGFRWHPARAGPLRFLRNGWQSWSATGARDLDAEGERPFPTGPWVRAQHHALGAPPADRSGWHESDQVTVVGAARGGPTCLAGAYECGRSFAIVYVRAEADGDVLLEVELRVDATLAPGAVLALERVRVALGAEASALLEAHAEAWGRSACARVARPFAPGWCSWYWAFHGVGEDDVRRNLEALAAARRELPVEVVQLDDGYQRAIGDWLETNERFPRGLAPLAAEIRDAGFAAGVWTAPFCAVAESALFAKHREWLLRRGEEPLRALLLPAWSRQGWVYALDPSRPEVVDHLGALFRALVDMGFQYLKLDFLYAVAHDADAHDPSLSRAGRLRRGLEAVRDGAGDEAFLLGCGCPLGAAVGVVDGMRIGPDVAPAWRHDPDAAVPGLEETLPATRSAVRSVLARAWMHRRLWQNDPDCLLARSTDTALAPGERAALAAAIAGTGGMAVISDDVARLSAADRALARTTIEAARAVDGSGIPGAARAVDLLDGEIAGAVWSSDGECERLALVNGGDGPAQRAAPAAAETCIGRAPALEGDPSRRALDPRSGALLCAPRRVPLAVFCDFDGTFSVQDVGATLAQRYAGERRPATWARYQRGEITAWEYNLEILDGLALPLHELDAFLRSVELDAGARALVAWCEQRSVAFRVASDGFDWNLNRLQALHGVRFAYAANHLRYVDGRWSIRAGHPNPDCPGRCGTGTCKGGLIEAFRARHPEARLVHVGNGRVSDTCGALAADVVFAKDTLAQELAARGIAFEPFATLLDVIPGLARVLADALGEPGAAR